MSCIKFFFISNFNEHRTKISYDMKCSYRWIPPQHLSRFNRCNIIAKCVIFIIQENPISTWNDSRHKKWRSDERRVSETPWDRVERVQVSRSANSTVTDADSVSSVTTHSLGATVITMSRVDATYPQKQGPHISWSVRARGSRWGQ